MSGIVNVAIAIAIIFFGFVMLVWIDMKVEEYKRRKKKGSRHRPKIKGIIFVFMLAGLVMPCIMGSQLSQMPEAEPPNPEPIYSSDNYTTTSDWDNGTKANTTTITDRYNISAGNLEIDFPYADKDANLMSYWRMENLTDETANHTLSNHGASATTGQYGGGYDLELDEDDYLYVADHNDFTFGDGSDDVAFSLSLWVNMESTPSVNMVSKWNTTGGNREWTFFHRNSDNKMIFMLFDESATAYIRQISTGTWSTTGTWTHFVATYDGSSSSGGMKIYKDGSSFPSGASDGGVYVAMENKAESMRIGEQDTGYHWDGQIDEVKIYTKELSSGEVTALYNSGDQYKDEGNWTSPLITQPSGEVLNNLTIDLNNSWTGNCIDKIEILNSTDAIISTDTTDLTTNGTIVRTNTTFDNGFNGTWENGSFKIKIYLVSPNTDTPIVQRLNYTTLVFDSEPPSFAGTLDVPDPQYQNEYVNTTSDITDNVEIFGAWINFTAPSSTTFNYSMVDGVGDEYYYNTSAFSEVGTWNYVIWANDTSDNWGSSSGSFQMLNSVPEMSNLTLDGQSVSTYYLNASGQVALNFTANDTATGGNNIAGGNCTNNSYTLIFNGSAIDGAFDEAVEDITLTMYGTNF
jgi:hypothetical protein